MVKKLRGRSSGCSATGSGMLDAGLPSAFYRPKRCTSVRIKAKTSLSPRKRRVIVVPEENCRVTEDAGGERVSCVIVCLIISLGALKRFVRPVMLGLPCEGDTLITRFLLVSKNLDEIKKLAQWRRISKCQILEHYKDVNQQDGVIGDLPFPILLLKSQGGDLTRTQLKFVGLY